MVDYNMTDTLSLVIAVMYFESKLRDDENCTGLTYDDLAVLFDRSKQTIFNAIKQNERKANELLQPTKLRAEARREAEKQRLEEERQRRLNIHIVNPPNLK
jgi:transposase